MKNSLLLFFLFSITSIFSQSNEEKYQKSINLADSCYQVSDYEKALKFYETASIIKPSEIYPKEKIIACNTYMRKIAEIKNLYHMADSCFNMKNFVQAHQLYMNILAIKSEETAKNRIIEIEKILKNKKESIKKEDEF